MSVLCDAHIHIVAPIESVPMVSPRTYTPPPATLDQLVALGAPEGIERFVVVQPSFYGTDNSVTLGALRTLGSRGRGVVVLDPAAAEAVDLAEHHRLGVRGLRLNLYSPGKGTLASSLSDRFHATAGLARRMGWHIEALADLPVMLEAESLLAESPVPVVIDHFGLPGRLTPDSPEGRRLLALVRRDHVWLKLSAPYRSVGDPLGIVPDPAWLAAFLEAAGERCVWGSDWPHTPPHEAQPGNAEGVPYRPLLYPDVVARFRAALPLPDLAEKIMGSNPARLYEF